MSKPSLSDLYQAIKDLPTLEEKIKFINLRRFAVQAMMFLEEEKLAILKIDKFLAEMRLHNEVTECQRQGREDYFDRIIERIKNGTYAEGIEV